MKTRSTSLALVVLTTVWQAVSLPAAVVTTSPMLPVLYPTGFYQYPSSGPSYGSGLITNGPGLMITLSGLQDRALTWEGTQAFGPNEQETHSSDLVGFMSVNLSPPVAMTATGLETVLVFNKVGNFTGTFNTELLSMNLSGVSPFGPFMIRESPTLASTGQTTITDIGGGYLQISSFFDVFTELSIDGGASWMPASDGPSHITLMPEPGTASLLASGALLWIGLRRRRT